MSGSDNILIDIDHVSKVYGRGVRALTAVRDLSLQVAKGEAVGIVGESGSGKSTLSRMLAALEKPTNGRILYRGVPIDSIPQRELRRRVQIVFQDPYGSLNRRKSVSQIIGAPLRVQGMRVRDCRAEVVRLLGLVGLGAELADRFPSELSGGQCQRVGIARALAVDPEFVIFDESVSAVDASARAQLMNLIRDLQDTLGLTYMFVTHDLAVVRYMTSRIVVMRRGDVVEQLTRDELLMSGHEPYTNELVAAVPRLRGLHD